MSRFKTLNEKALRKKTIMKKRPSGRCYNFEDGKGWNHYTKGYRKHHTKSEVLENGTVKLYSFLGDFLPEENVYEKINEAIKKGKE